jgi:hypothetical protein
VQIVLDLGASIVGEKRKEEKYWALYFEELVLQTHKGFVEPHSTSTLDTRGGNLIASVHQQGKRVMHQLEEEVKNPRSFERKKRQRRIKKPEEWNQETTKKMI